MKRVILTTEQINKVLKESDTNSQTLQFTMPKGGTPSQVLASTEAQQAIQKAKGVFGGQITAQVTPSDGPSDYTLTTPNPTGSGSNGAVENSVENTKAIENGFNVNYDVTNEHKSFSKRQIEEARLEKLRKEGTVMTKKQLKEEWEEKPNDDANQWNDEFKMFMQGIRNGEAIEFGDNTIAVEIFKGRTASNDPRYVMFTKGDNRLQDDHFYIQHSQPLNPKYIREIYNCAGWEYDENCEDYEQLNEDEVDWNQRKQMRMDNFWDTLEYYIGLKDEQGSLNPEQLAHAEDVCNKLSCFGADAEEFCNYAREALGLNQIDESYKWYLDNDDDISGGFDSSQFISHFREIEEKYYDLPEDYELEDYYNRLLEEWGDFSDEERSSYKSFEQYCDSVISDYLYEKYSEKGMNKMQESKIEINPKNKGKFNATKKRTGKSTEELTHSKNPLTRKRAIFSQNAKKWNKK